MDTADNRPSGPTATRVVEINLGAASARSTPIPSDQNAGVRDEASTLGVAILASQSLTITAQITDTALAAFTWSYGQLLSAWNPATGLVRNKVADASGEFDAIQATGSLAAATALAEQLGVVGRDDAIQIVNRISHTLLVETPRYHGLWPHFVETSPDGVITIVPGTEWSSVDTVIAAVALLAAQHSLGLDTFGAEQMLRAVDWEDLTGGPDGHDRSGLLGCRGEVLLDLGRVRHRELAGRVGVCGGHRPGGADSQPCAAHSQRIGLHRRVGLAVGVAAVCDRLLGVRLAGVSLSSRKPANRLLSNKPPDVLLGQGRIVRIVGRRGAIPSGCISWGCLPGFRRRGALLTRQRRLGVPGRACGYTALCSDDRRASPVGGARHVGLAHRGRLLLAAKQRREPDVSTGFES